MSLHARSLLRVPDQTPVRARFPVIDAHNHLWGRWESVVDTVQVMDEAGVVALCDLTANIEIEFGGGGYVLGPGDFGRFLRACAEPYPRHFYGFTTANLARTPNGPLFTDAQAFVAETLRLLQVHAEHGARGLKVLKELGMSHRDGSGRIIPIDDERLAPVWEEAGRLGLPVLIHQADPEGFFLEPTPDNEHFETLEKFPAWRFCGPGFPSFAELQRRYRNLVRNHPHTTFLLPHMANWPENLAAVGEFLDECPNACVDFSARTDELGRQPHTAREFFLRYQDRILFGTDMPPSLEVYRYHFRFLETYDEWFIPPDYDGTFARFRWRVSGLGLPGPVLEQIYFRNALRLIPGLRQQTASVFPTKSGKQTHPT